MTRLLLALLLSALLLPAQSLPSRSESDDPSSNNSAEGVPKDPVEVVKWYRKAAEQGDAKAQYTLGFCYFVGDGVAKDAAEVVKW
jgi:TPR repeat protein